MTEPAPDTILLDLFRTNQLRERLIEASLDGLELPPEDYPFYVLIGAEGPWTPTLLAERMKMPLSTVLFRVGRLEKRGHVERVPNPDDRRSYLISLNADGREAAQAGPAAIPRLRRVRRAAARREEHRRPARRADRAARGDRSRAQLRVRSATDSTCGVCGNMSTGRARSSV